MAEWDCGWLCCFDMSMSFNKRTTVAWDVCGEEDWAGGGIRYSVLSHKFAVNLKPL